MFTFLNIEIVKKEKKLDLLIEAGALLRHEDETQEMKQQQKEVCGRQTLVALAFCSKPLLSSFGRCDVCTCVAFFA